MKNIDNILKRCKWENRNKTKTKTHISRKPALGERGKNPKHPGLDTRGRLATDLHKAAKPKVSKARHTFGKEQIAVKQHP